MLRCLHERGVPARAAKVRFLLVATDGFGMTALAKGVINLAAAQD